jgi:signal transduction histidine kinase
VTLRSRLLIAFLLVGLGPLITLAVAVDLLVTRRFEEEARDRLGRAGRSVAARIVELRRESAASVAEIARDGLPRLAAAGAPEPQVAAVLGEQRNLPALEIVGADGRLVSSRHWSVGFGLEDLDQTFPGEDAFRVEKVGEGLGVAERLALMPSARGRWRGAPVVVRGGVFLDASFLAEASQLVGARVGLWDGVRRRWIGGPKAPLAPPAGSPWPEPGSAAPRGVAELSGVAYAWESSPLCPGLWLVVATARSSVEGVTAEIRRIGLAVLAAALLLALAGAVMLSERVARPVRELAEGARRVAEGDYRARAPLTSDGEIGELARAFDAMTLELAISRERALRAERVAAWREMARRLAHELKNPLFPIQLSLETLRRAYDRVGTGGGAEAAAIDFATLFRESADTILQELESLKRIVAGFGEFARLPPPKLGPTDVNAVVEQVLALYQPRAAGVVVERSLAAELPSARADAELLARALGNLVANALDAMPGGGALRLRTSARPGLVSIEVEDTGPGLDEAQRERLFTPYYTTKPGGTGLGLAIVQSLVSDQGGQVEVRSRKGEGATFTLLLPSAGEEGAEPA